MRRREILLKEGEKGRNWARAIGLRSGEQGEESELKRSFVKMFVDFSSCMDPDKKALASDNHEGLP